MLDQDKILSFIKVTGPTIPAKVAKNINTNILLASAHLSDLASQGKIKISKLKIGGSPLYFLPGQEAMLFDFAADNVNPKDFLVLEKLKDQKVLREADLELVEKVGLRNLKDFAIPLNVNIPNKTELFWKWHLMSNEEANINIKEILTGVKETVTTEDVPEVVAETEVEPEKVVEETTEEVQEEVEEKEETKEPVQETPVVKAKEEVAEEKEIKEEQKKLTEESKKAEKKVIEKEEVEEETFVEKESTEKEEKKPTVMQKIKDKIIRKKKKVVEDEFSPVVNVFFESLRIIIRNKEIVRKNSEIDYSVKVPSAVGHITYFCKAKSKNRCDEKDISAAYMEAQTKKLPLLFLYTNEITKKAEEMLESGVFENVVVRKIDDETK
ncbi:hypothetical protein HOE37_04640 [Candidatus Woesearchaeota archaeon]|jgi:hypothetical protein|nr:hypothetical protein [Candidatus Woesearchaeota archaeon]MBT4111119.1 hypothetical protein [Candidatus Woesearchaeota archaeon]MBT4335763.1 hypothetical protein [Candidatus Woesearchaeota archaeon]MBT4469286.1 hypothetical protein [Candidatus Woesearchaeota archaeon]MBT6744258.1 hypothetical protein [Candidatus Woesearchaeota archaeon]